MRVSPLFRNAAGFLATALLLAPAAASARSAPHAQIAVATCSNGNLVPTASDLGAVRAAIVCLHSQIRAEHHLPLLTENATLRGAAVGHSTNMVSNRYFGHTDPSGMTLMDRLLGAHYVGRNQDWVMGENLAWATGVESTPAGSVPGLDSLARPPCQHPAPLLPRRWRRRRRRDRRTADGNIGATYTAGFGARRQSPGGLPPKR